MDVVVRKEFLMTRGRSSRRRTPSPPPFALRGD
jgi:hypothetical protein